MKFIEKKEVPDEYLKYCKNAIKKKKASYSDLKNPKNKDILNCLKVSLLEEQGYICCYCGDRINLDKMTIEHLESRDEKPDKQIDYRNLLASCYGGQKEREKVNKQNISNKEKNKKSPLYCNSHKKNRRITLTPLMKECEEDRFKFTKDGRIFCDLKDKVAQETIEVLNLDNYHLNNLRKHAFLALDMKLKFQDDKDNFLKSKLEELRKGTKGENGVIKFEAFCFATMYYIEKYKMNKVV